MRRIKAALDEGNIAALKDAAQQGSQDGTQGEGLTLADKEELLESLEDIVGSVDHARGVCMCVHAHLCMHSCMRVQFT